MSDIEQTCNHPTCFAESLSCEAVNRGVALQHKFAMKKSSRVNHRNISNEEEKDL